MKIIAIAIFAIMTITVAPNIETTDSLHFRGVAENKTKETMKDTTGQQTRTRTAQNSSEKKSAQNWQDNPNNCNTKTEYIRADNLKCIKKSTTQTPTPSGNKPYYNLISQYDWNVDVAWAVMMAESGGNTHARNLADNHGSCIGSFGVFQLACLHQHRLNGSSFSDPSANVAAAYQIYSESGWGPWGAYSNGSYLVYLN